MWIKLPDLSSRRIYLEEKETRKDRKTSMRKNIERKNRQN